MELPLPDITKYTNIKVKLKSSNLSPLNDTYHKGFFILIGIAGHSDRCMSSPDLDEIVQEVEFTPQAASEQEARAR